jgi:hypothetical protein
VVSRLLAFRPPSVVDRLDPRSQACILSTRELLGPAAELGVVLPLVRAPVAAVARAVLVAAKELQSAVGLALPAGAPPEPWFDAVARAADEVAAGLPVFLAGEVVVEGEDGIQVERAFLEAWRLVDAGLTHVAIDVAAIAAGERGRVAGEIAQAGADRGTCIEVVVPLAEGAQSGPRGAAMLDELARGGAPADLASVRCGAPEGPEEARLQAAAVAHVLRALGGVPGMRRGAVTPAVLDLLRGSPVRVCEDGGAAAARALGLLPRDVLRRDEEARARESALEQAAARLSPAESERLEALAYVEAVDFLERLGGGGSGPALARALAQRLEDR